MEILLDPNLWIAFAMLTGLEIVLGIDNIIFISILVGRLPTQQRDKARRLGERRLGETVIVLNAAIAAYYMLTSGIPLVID